MGVPLIGRDADNVYAEKANAGASTLNRNSSEDARENRKHVMITLFVAFFLSTITHGIGKWPV